MTKAARRVNVVEVHRTDGAISTVRVLSAPGTRVALRARHDVGVDEEIEDTAGRGFALPCGAPI
jgi:hypothetical protein